MSEDADEALLRSMFAEAPRPPLGDERFVGAVMGTVSREAARAQSRVSTLAWIGGAAAAFFAATNFTVIVAEFSRLFAAVPVPIDVAQLTSGGAATILLVAAAAGGAWLVSERG